MKKTTKSLAYVTTIKFGIFNDFSIKKSIKNEDIIISIPPERFLLQVDKDSLIFNKHLAKST
ncbi:hypothetical protein [uncultured Formosa sp.]|uniref:hypothetical protein n=1 Tax=uncultured Formosa sp. TaxID=255435 RepID=UPI002612E603|nr:hypothetical protein [uncultured Formosa sp.]